MLDQLHMAIQRTDCADLVMQVMLLSITDLKACAQAETSGTVSKMLVENGTPVTPGQPLLVIKS